MRSWRFDSPAEEVKAVQVSLKFLPMTTGGWAAALVANNSDAEMIVNESAQFFCRGICHIWVEGI